MGKRSSQIEIRRSLELADLTDSALARLGYSRADVIATAGLDPDYPITSKWGQCVWDTTRYAGIVWNSRRSKDKLAYMLFIQTSRQDRVVHRSSDFETTAGPVPLETGGGYGAVLDAASRRNVDVIVD